MPKPTVRPEAFLRALFDAAVAAADPMLRLPAFLPSRPLGRVVVVGAGKASARMAEAVEAQWGPCEGLVIVRDGYARPTEGIEIAEASHPVTDLRGVRATERMVALLCELGPDDHALALISGGASALLEAPVEGIGLEDLQSLNRALLASGAPIGDMNVVRRALSRVKGGGLAAACTAPLLALLISDVPGDDSGAIGSGPTVPSGEGPAERATRARAVLDRWSVAPPPAVATVLDRLVRTGYRMVRSASDRVTNRIIAAPSQSLEAASDLARGVGCDVRVLGDALEGEARDLALKQAALARRARGLGRPLVLLSGGECTVTRTGDGVGGPNAEFALALAIALEGDARVHAIACDTDGVDGAAEVAGAEVGPGTLERARGAGVDAEKALARNDAHGFFAAIDAQVVTGPTLTNVNDFRALLVLPESRKE